MDISFVLDESATVEQITQEIKAIHRQIRVASPGDMSLPTTGEIVLVRELRRLVELRKGVLTVGEGY